MKAYQLKITLKDTHPPIWRRIIIPAGLTFTQLSVVLNEVMDWDGSHLYSFEFQNRRLRIEEVAEDFPGFGGMDVLEAFFLSERKNKPMGQYDAYRQLSEGKGFGRVQGVSPKSRFDEAGDFFDMDDFDMDQMLKDMAKMRKTLGKHLLRGLMKEMLR